MEETTKESNSTRFSILMFPWLAHGHISPFLELAKRLAKNNFKIYFCSTEINLSFIKKDRNLDEYFSDHSMELVQFDLPHFPELPPHYHTTKNLPPHLNRTLHLAFNMGKANFQNILNTLKPDLLIYDMFQPWASELASLIHVPSVFLLITGVASLSWLYFYQHALNKGSSGINETSYPFPAIFLRDHEIKKMAALVKDFQKNIPDEVQLDLSPFKCLEVSSDIVLVKSWREIEGKYIDYLSSCCGRKMIAVGHLAKLKHDDNEELEETNSHLIEFLNGRDESSVVYISFGSETFLSKEDREELAYGLELSNANFIWVVRIPAGQAIALEEALPQGFLERVKDRGIVVDGWAPQAKILEHPSTGGFVSHCGWGAVIESVYYGLPLLALPMLYDQPRNARLAVEIGIGIEILKDENGQVKREEVAKVIKEVIVEKKELGELVKRKAKELSHKFREEGEEGLHEAVEKLRSLCSKNK